MALTDGDVAALARQAVDLLDPDIDITITPEDSADPYRWGGRAWLIRVENLVALHVRAEWTPTQALLNMLDTMAKEIAETSRGVGFPRCLPDHRHPARVDVDGRDVVLTCPDTGETVARLVPGIPS